MKYIIHRGITSNKVGENSYKSIKKAIRDYSAVGVEFDVRMTKDNKIVLSHDPFIGFDYIENMNYFDIIDKRYLTTFDKVLTITTNKILLVDIKVNGNYKVFGDTIIHYLNSCDKNIYLCSFNKKIIKYLRNKVKCKLGYILFTYKKNNGDFEMINYNGISDKKINKIKDKEVFLWTASNKKRFNNIQNKFSNINDYFIIIDKRE